MKSSGFVAMAALFLGFFGLFGSSGRTFHLMPGTMVPAATGTVHVKRGKNNPNMDLDIKVKNLALPGSLTPPANEYIVWIEPHGDQPLKQGAIGVDGKLQGELKTQTTAKNFNVIITAERSEAVTSPSGPVILHGHIAD